MADPRTVARALAILAETFPKDITPELVRIYQHALRDASDDQVLTAVRRAIDTARFFPVPAELRDLIGLNQARVVVDPEPILDRIRGMASYLPTVGDLYPRIDAVRDALGDAIAAAYAAAGGPRLFTANEVGRDIARREFAAALADAVRIGGLEAIALPTPETPRALPPADASPSGPPGRLGRVPDGGADWRALLARPKQGAA